MKTQNKNTGRLNLKKQTVTKLNESQMNEVVAGGEGSSDICWAASYAISRAVRSSFACGSIMQ